MRAGGHGDDPEHLLDLLEPGWAARLSGRALVAEADPEAEPGVLAAVVKALDGQTPETSAARWPACLLFAVTGVVAARYRRGSPWVVWWRACGRRSVPADEAERWARAVRAALGTLGLATFPSSGGDELLLRHTAVPDVKGGDGPAPRESGLWLEAFGRGPLIRGRDGVAAPANPADAGNGPAVFDADGTVVPEDLPLPADTVWLLHPADLSPTADGPLRVVAHGRLPPTWSGWRLVQVALDEASWLSTSEPGGARRPVRGRSRPQLSAGAPVDGLFLAPGTGDGLRRPVHAAPPTLTLPAGPTVPVDWTAQIRDAGGRILITRRLAGAEGARTPALDELWRDAPRPLLGVFTIRVTGPAGLGLVRCVAIAEGLELAVHPVPRLLGAEGLERAEVVPHPPPGMSAMPAALSFGPAEDSRILTLATRRGRMRCVVVPPRMRVAIEGEYADPEVARPLVIDRARLAASGRLRLDLPGARRPPLLELVVAGQVVQILKPHRDGGYSLRRVADTASVGTETVLALTHDDRRATVAWIRGAPASVDDPWLPRHK